ncbi:hypothetical protein CBR_g55009 [Chara braunii]|uniref:BAG domain-containing protein n=1 Tax=Chara braunii TaxID=69332 RepID=A0A388K7K1_CHABU|nr:hypothetical protein CBR_g55009 [Chara braunii]|eukprot:GBG66030.1 hypothetical protein CBR_g55009 [Chara braunii]
MATSDSPAGRVVSSPPPSGGAKNARLIPLPVIAAAAIGFVILGFFGGRRRALCDVDSAVVDPAALRDVDSAAPCDGVTELQAQHGNDYPQRTSALADEWRALTASGGHLSALLRGVNPMLPCVSAWKLRWWHRHRRGRKTGGGSGRHPVLGNRRSSESSAASGEGGGGRHGGRPASLAELRAARASAAESRMKNGGMGGRSVGAASLTPLGCAIVVCRKVDGLEDDATKLIACVKDKGFMDDKMKKDQAMLIELLMQAQLELDGIKGDESVRPLRKVQTKRMHEVIQELEKLSDISPDPPKGGGDKASSTDTRPPS